MKIQEVLNYISRTLERISTVAVVALKKHVFSVQVKNFPKVQSVKGTVVVGNQKRLEEELKAVKKGLESVAKAIESQKYPETVAVSNLKDTPLVEIPKPLPYPTEITVKNPTKEVSVNNLDELQKSVAALEKSIKAIKLDPTIQVKPNITVEPTSVSIPKLEIPKPEKLLSSDPKKYLPVRLTDGEEFYNAISSIIGGMKRSLFRTADGQDKYPVVDDSGYIQVVVRSMPVNPLDEYVTADVREDGDITYIGAVKSDGSWYVQKIESNTFRYAFGATSYPDSFADRENLNYQYLYEALA